MFLGILSITIALIALLALIMSQFLVPVLVSLQIDDWEKLKQLYSYYNLISLEYVPCFVESILLPLVC